MIPKAHKKNILKKSFSFKKQDFEDLTLDNDFKKNQ